MKPASLSQLKLFKEKTMTQKQFAQSSDKCKALAAAIRSELSISVFSHKSSYAKNNAQSNLGDKTHYVDDGTLSYFKARINSAGNVDAGLLFYVIESHSIDSNHTARQFRFVIFDLFGTVIERAAMGEGWKTSSKASAEMWEFLNAFDTAAHYASVLESRAKRLETEAAAMRDIAKMGA
jgi:hypothetical protein